MICLCMANKNKCENCLKNLELGCDATRIERGVIGHRGFVPSDETLLFCSEACVAEHFDASDLPAQSPRVP